MTTSSQGRYTLLVANFSRPTPSMITGSDSIHIGPTKTRSGFVFGHLFNLGFSNDPGPNGVACSNIQAASNMGLEPFENDPPTLPSATVTVANNTFSAGSASLLLGPYELAAYRDFTPGGGVNATATAIATAIGNLGHGFAATPVAATVTVTGPLGTAPASLQFRAVYGSTTANFTFTYPGMPGFLGYTDSPLVVDILPPSPILYEAP